MQSVAGREGDGLGNEVVRLELRGQLRDLDDRRYVTAGNHGVDADLRERGGATGGEQSPDAADYLRPAVTAGAGRTVTVVVAGVC